jgi:hypothetical protein
MAGRLLNLRKKFILRPNYMVVATAEFASAAACLNCGAQAGTE